MRKTLVVAAREYKAAVKSKAFIVSMVAMPIMMGGSIVFQAVMKDRVDITDKRMGVVDYSGEMWETLVEAADHRHDPATEDGIFKGEGDDRKQVLPRFVLERIEPETDDIDELGFALSERVRNHEMFAFVIIQPGAVAVTPAVDGPQVVYHSSNPAYGETPRWLSSVLNDRAQAVRIEKLGLDAAIVRQVTAPVQLDQRGLVTRDESGKIRKADRANELAAIFVPLGTMMLMFMMIMLGAPPLVHSILEEKMQRIAEVLLASISPFELMMGKLIGMVAISLTMLVIYLGGAAYAVHRAGFEQYFPGHLVAWFVAYQCLAILMFGSIFISIGAAVTDIREAQSTITPVMILVIFPMFVWFQVIREPNSTLAVVLSLIPTATPMLMIVRQATTQTIPLWQPVLGMFLVLLCTTACVLAAGRIFRVGILMQGKGAKLGEMLRWVFRG